MRKIRISQLKRQTSEVVRSVRDEQAGYVITLRGKPVAMIVPFREPEEQALSDPEAWWARVEEIDRLMEEETPHAGSAVEQLFGDREARMRSLLGEDRDA